MAARIERWGGAQPLAARVRLVEPAAFTKISALGDAGAEGARAASREGVTRVLAAARIGTDV